MTDTRPGAPVLRNPLAETLAAGRLGVALLVQKVHSVDIALAARTCGFDALSVDLEHSVISESAAAQICITAMQVGVTPLVRVPSHAAHYANRLLDAGACGIVAPHVNTAEEAHAIAQACRFAPQGQRSVAGNWPHLGYRSWPAAEVGRIFNAATTVVVMLETPEAIANADAIAAVPGVDILHVGSTDLCESLGIPGQVADPALERCYAQVVAACRGHGKVAGAGGLAATPDVLRTMLRMGVRFVTAGIEWDFLIAGAQQRANLLRSLPLE
jgi:2-keto-3-deoxy-L-rhamnonate aldolase RhmA